ncbi:hypothetical protein [Paenibacillus kyungheensis]
MTEEERISLEQQLNELLTRSEWTASDAPLIEQLLHTLQTVSAENKRLRTALLKVNAQQPKMSSRLRDALYE